MKEILVDSDLYGVLYGATAPKHKKEITRYEPNCEHGCGWSMGVWSTGTYVKYIDHLAAIEEAKKEERERMMEFAEWYADHGFTITETESGGSLSIEDKFEYYQKNVEGK